MEQNPVTLALIAFIACASIAGFSNPGVIMDYLFDISAIRQRREYFRILTAGFLHANWTHLLVNGFSLFVFARNIEIGFGMVPLLTIFLVSVIGGNLLAMLLHWNEFGYRALGASGGVCGVIFAAIFLTPGMSVIVFPIPFPIKAWLYAILFVGFSVYGAKRRRDNVGHDAHLGGAILGLLATTAMYPWIVMQDPVLYFGVLFAGVSGVVYLRGFKSN